MYLFYVEIKDSNGDEIVSFIFINQKERIETYLYMHQMSHTDIAKIMVSVRQNKHVLQELFN